MWVCPDPWVGKIPWGRAWQPTPVFLPGESHGQRNLVGCSQWGCKESDMTEATGNSIHIVHICQPQSHHLSLSPFPLVNHKLVFYICDLISVL